MNYAARYRNADLVEVCLAGAGGFGRCLLAQSVSIPLLNVRVVVEREPEIAVAALRELGFSPSTWMLCTNATEAKVAYSQGKKVVTDDLAAVIDLPFAVLVEATGHPEGAARHARMAVEAGRHVAMVSKEADCVVGPLLAHMAGKRERVVTPVDGDQPSLLIGLISWAEVLGLEILAAGKSSEYDFVFDPEAGTLTSNGHSFDCPQMGETLTGETTDLIARIARRARLAAPFVQRAVPDLCELSIVANATGFLPDRPDLHAPLARIQEVPSLFRPRSEGGIFSETRVLDVFHCVRRPFELSLAGGVFIVVRCGDAKTWRLLGEKGHILSPDGRTAMLTIPRHLLGVEAATTLLDAAILGETSGREKPSHQVDLTAVAHAELPAGTHLTMGGHHHTIENVGPRIVPAGALGPDAAAPFYIAANRTLIRSVGAGDTIKMADLDLTRTGELLQLRRVQDTLFFPSRETAVRETA